MSSPDMCGGGAADDPAGETAQPPRPNPGGGGGGGLAPGVGERDLGGPPQPWRPSVAARRVVGAGTRPELRIVARRVEGGAVPGDLAVDPGHVAGRGRARVLEHDNGSAVAGQVA